MAWDALLLGIVGIYATYKTSVFSKQYESLKYLGYALAALFFTFGQASVVLDAILDSQNLTVRSPLVLEWTTIISISFLLSSLAVFIRESKPVFAQFPLIYAAFPLLLVISYWLVKDTLAIKEWLMSIYQGGTLMVALLMYGVHTYRAERYTYIFSGTLIFLLTYVLYWFMPGVKTSYIWIWEVLLGISLIFSTYGLEYSIQHSEDRKKEPGIWH